MELSEREREALAEALEHLFIGISVGWWARISQSCASDRQDGSTPHLLESILIRGIKRELVTFKC